MDRNRKTMKRILCFIFLPLLFSFTPDNRKEFFPKKTEVVQKIPSKKTIWVFLLAGQSNMAGRGKVEPQDTLPNERVWTINSKGQLILAKEPIHFQEPGNEGLDCGLTFGKEMIKHLPQNIRVLILPTAIGGSSISQWIGDSLFRDVRLLSNFRQRVEQGKKVGTIKGVLWHQGEADATPQNIPLYKERLAILFSKFRSAIGNPSLPIILGELGSFPYSYENWMKINAVMREYCKEDHASALISTSDLNHKGDSVHFDSEGQRRMGQRYAHTFLSKFK